MKRYSISLVILLGSLGCGGGDDSSSTTLEPTLSSIQDNILNSGCALPSCHSSAASQGDLSLDDGDSFAQLVGIASVNPAAAAAGKKRVVAGDPDISFLMQKLESPGAGEGDLMPQSGDPLSQAEIDVIREWIANGALNN